MIKSIYFYYFIYKNRRSDQTRGGVLFWILLFDYRLSAHIRSERFGDIDAAVGVEIVLEERDQHTGRCYTGIVEGMCIIFAVLAGHADL